MTTKMLAALTLLLAAPAAHATLITTASVSAPTAASGTVTAVKVAGMATPSKATITTAAYSLSFADVASGQGVVNGSSNGNYAVPVAGVSNGSPTYLTGDYGSGTTTSIAASGNYLSTGTGDIVLSFTSVQKSLSLLWGSVDSYNTITFLDASGNTLDTLTGSAILALTQSGTASGFQGYGGSAYVTATESAGFSAVKFASSMPSFEFAAIAASTGTFAVPEPATLSIFGAGLALAGVTRRRRKAAARAALPA